MLGSGLASKPTHARWVYVEKAEKTVYVSIRFFAKIYKRAEKIRPWHNPKNNKIM